MANFNKAIDAYETLVSTGKLGKLTPAEVNGIYFTLKDIKKIGVSGTTSKSVADWFKRYGFTIKEIGAGWQISK